jgi:hypothetical protein
LGVPDLCDRALRALENVIRNGQKVSEKTLRIFTDNLYLAEDDDIRKKSFQLLDIADRNQDLTDEIFEKLELARAGKVISSN